MIRMVCYADEKMTKAQELCVKSSLKMGVGEFYSAWSRTSLMHHPDFYRHNKKILECERGSGYWLWKPFIIYEAILKAEDGDILIYADAGIEFIAPVNEIINRMDEDIFFFTNGFPHVEWCKGDVLKNILGWNMTIDFESKAAIQQRANLEFLREFKQVQASVIFFKVNQNTRDFVKEWLLWCQMPGFIDDSPSKLPNYPMFAEHRHDQAILTCLQIKYGYKLHFWPTNYSEHIRHTARPEDDYPALFNHHRKRNHEWEKQ